MTLIVGINVITFFTVKFWVMWKRYYVVFWLKPEQTNWDIRVKIYPVFYYLDPILWGCNYNLYGVVLLKMNSLLTFFKDEFVNTNHQNVFMTACWILRSWLESTSFSLPVLHFWEFYTNRSLSYLKIYYFSTYVS